METISEHSTLAEIVNLRPGSARVLESYELDYCCHGQRPLSEACEASGTDPGAVLESVRSAHDVSGGPGDRAWLDMQAGPLAAHIESTHHRYLHEEMPRLDALAEKVASVHGERHPELRTLLETYRELTADLVTPARLRWRGPLEGRPAAPGPRRDARPRRADHPEPARSAQRDQPRSRGAAGGCVAAGARR